jgi:hypothetical protein
MVVKSVPFVIWRSLINHLFFACPIASLVWRVVHFTFDVSSPVTNMFGKWINGVEKHTKARIRLGVCALVWTLWNCRNDMVFNKIGTAHFLQVIYMATHRTREWSYLLSEAQWAPMNSRCSRLEMVARAIYNQGG